MFSLLSKARSPPLVNFKHYGHPIRDRRSVGLGDRGREIALMALVYLFALYFPSGFVALIWMEPEVQYLWFRILDLRNSSHACGSYRRVGWQ